MTLPEITLSQRLRLCDVVRPDGKIFIKSEWEPAAATWPAVSFSKRKRVPARA